MRRLPLAAYMFAVDMAKEPARVAVGPEPTPCPEPHPADVLPEPYRSNEKIRAAEVKRAMRAAKRRAGK